MPMRQTNRRRVALSLIGAMMAGWLGAGCQTTPAEPRGADPGLRPTAVRTAQADGSDHPARNYVPWRERVGPAYPGDFWRSWGRDGKEFVEIFWDDTVAVATNPLSLALLGTAGVAGIVINSSNVDEKVAQHYYNNGPALNTFWDMVGDVGGNPGTHFALAGVMYFAGLAEEDVETYENAKTLLQALALNGALTQSLKWAAHTEAPNGDENVWPSGHTSSTFTLATVMWHQYGPLLGVPLMGFASYVGYERIDAANHNFSDVISGALIGIAVGHVVAQQHELRLGGFEVQPYVGGENAAVGLALVKQF